MSEKIDRPKPPRRFTDDVKPEDRAAVEAWYADLPDDFAERINAMRGCLAHVDTSADDFARRKQEEIDLEEAKFRRYSDWREDNEAAG